LRTQGLPGLHSKDLVRKKRKEGREGEREKKEMRKERPGKLELLVFTLSKWP
jgi:hypothetical protein